jgi:nicotinamide riboside kinase
MFTFYNNLYSLKIIITGPESSGKTTLASWIALEYQWCLVPEFAREYLKQNDGKYLEHDLIMMALLQRWDEKCISDRCGNVVCDTDILTIIIWQLEKYGGIDPSIWAQWKDEKHKWYLLCKPDMPWEEDPLRENPDDRDRLFNKYHQFLLDNNKKFTIISGSLENRKHQVTQLLSGN